MVAEDIIVEVIVNMIAVGRSLTFDNYKILNVSAKRIVLLQIKYCALDFFTCISNLLTNSVSLCQIIFGRFRVVLKQVVERKLGETGACWDSMGGIKQCRNLHFRAGRQD